MRSNRPTTPSSKVSRVKQSMPPTPELSVGNPPEEIAGTINSAKLAAHLRATAPAPTVQATGPEMVVKSQVDAALNSLLKAKATQTTDGPATEQ